MKQETIRAPAERDLGIVDPDKKIDATMGELRQMIRLEMERFLFTNICDDMKDEEEANSGLSDADNSSELKAETTQIEADRAFKKRLHKRREGHRKEINKKREQRHKCRAQRVKENNTFQRWKEIVCG
jgi:hypothetical protein